MPTQPKPAPKHEVEELLLGLFGWLRVEGCTVATVPIRAKREIYSALRANELQGAAEIIAAGFLVALDTWLHLAAPELRRRGGPTAVRVASEAEERQRDEALDLLRALSMNRFIVSRHPKRRVAGRHGACDRNRAVLRARIARSGTAGNWA
jgi:hypothetical protein